MEPHVACFHLRLVVGVAMVAGSLGQLGRPDFVVRQRLADDRVLDADEDASDRHECPLFGIIACGVIPSNRSSQGAPEISMCH